jgi:hypothetical protein
MATPPDFTSGQILTAAQMNAVGSWLVKTQTVGTAVSSVTVTGAFSADYDNYKIIYDGGTSSNNVSLGLKIGSASSGYYSAILFNRYSDANASGSASTTGTSFSDAGRGSTTKNNLNVEVFGPFLTVRTGMRQLSLDYFTSGFMINGGGFLNDATSHTSFTITPALGESLTGGTIRVYGYRN